MAKYYNCDLSRILLLNSGNFKYELHFIFNTYILLVYM